MSAGVDMTGPMSFLRLKGKVIGVGIESDGLHVVKVRVENAVLPNDELKLVGTAHLGEEVSVTVSFLGPYKNGERL